MFYAIILPMKNETSEKINHSEIAIKAIESLSILKRKLAENEDFSKKPKDPLQGALENLSFFENIVPTQVSEYLVVIGKTIDFKYKALSFFSPVPIMYNPPELPGNLGYAFDPIHKPARLSEALLKRLWNANINRNAVRAFGSLSQEEIVLKLQNSILSSIK